jgi:hypothetical protein
VSFAGLMAWDVNVREGRDSAAAQTLEDEDAGGLEGPVGDEGEAATVWPWLDPRR